jgi:hypothetical protein
MSMRITTFASIAILGLSSAVIAQVTTAPTEQKLGNAPVANDIAVAENTLAPPANEAAPASSATPDGNAARAAPPAGEPNAATSAPPKP